MIKDAMEKNAGMTASDREMAVLKEHFSGCFHGEEFDLEAFARLVGKGAKVVREGYGLSFLGRDYGRLVAARETETVLVPDEAHNAKPENRDSRNLYVTGDNLDALKHLLGSYAGAVKCIYIDPPYNTGSDGFVYNDSFSFSAPELAEKLGVSEEESARVLDLTHRSSASHSAWLLFLYPRLLLARELLASDGVIFISIDDNEQANLKLLCDEVFGEEHFVGQITILSNPKGRSQDKYLATNHEYALLYSRGEIEKGALSILKDENQINTDYPEQDANGRFRLLELRNTHREFGQANRPNLYYPLFVNPDDLSISLEPAPNFNPVFPVWDDGFKGCWTWSKSKTETDVQLLVAKRNSQNGGIKVFRKAYAEGAERMLKTVLVDNKFTTESGQKWFNDLFETRDKIFQFPKSVDLIKTFVAMSAKSGDMVLDFFSGSATTAEAVMRLNAEDNGNRRFLLVQWPEVCKENSEAQRAGYRTIDEIGRARIEKAAATIRVESPLFHGDLGFKHYRIAAPTRESVAKMWDYKPDSLVEDSSLLAEFGEATVLATWLAHDGYGLSAEPAEVDFAGYKGRFIGRHLYFTRPGLTDEAVLALCERIETDPAFNPENLVLFGYSFPWSAFEHLRINLARSKSLAKNLVVRMDVRY